MTAPLRERLAYRFSRLSRKRKRDLLHQVVSNMLDNEAWDACADLMIDQLGDNDAAVALDEPVDPIRDNRVARLRTQLDTLSLSELDALGVTDLTR